MKRFHVHVAVTQLEESVRFYSTIFGVAPSVLKEDYAKWMLEDPRINFAISRRGHAAGLNHLGLQVEEDGELKDMRARLDAADTRLVEQRGEACCYARSDKYWITDPQGIAWETFHTLETIPVFGEPPAEESVSNGCCVPASAGGESCCAA